MVPTPVTGTLSVELAARVFPAFGSPEPSGQCPDMRMFTIKTGAPADPAPAVEIAGTRSRLRPYHDERWVHDFVDHVYLGNRYICEVCGYTLNQG
jgi:hypothetical protein